MMGSPPELGTKYMHCCHWSVVSDCLQPHGLQPARLLHPRDSPGKKTGVGCHFLVQGDLPDPGIKRRSPASQADSFLAEPPGNM